MLNNISFNSMKVKILIVLAILVFVGCSDDPSSVGKKVIPDIDNLQTRELETTATFSSNYSITTSNNSNTLMVGKFQDESLDKIEAKMLLQFPVPIDTNIANSIISTEIKMLPNYAFKDTVGKLYFKIHRMTKGWEEYSFTKDSLTPDSYDDQIVIDTVNRNVSTSDSLLSFSIDKELIKKWLKKENENYGLVLIPDLSMNSIFGYHSYYISPSDDGRPQLIINYQDTDTSQKTIILRAQKDATIFSGESKMFSESIFYVQGGLIERGKLKFDTLAIPRHATITQATLELKIDVDSTIFSPFADKRIIVHQITGDDSIPELGGFTTTGDLVDNSYAINIRTIVQQWVTGKPNYGIALRTGSEFTQVERIAIKGFKSEINSRPKLKIKYTYIP